MKNYIYKVQVIKNYDGEKFYPDGFITLDRILLDDFRYKDNIKDNKYYDPIVDKDIHYFAGSGKRWWNASLSESILKFNFIEEREKNINDILK